MNRFKVVDPWGKILLDMKIECPSIGTVDIDLNLIDQIKRKMPIEEHRRNDLYHLISYKTNNRSEKKKKKRKFSLNLLLIN